MANIQAGKWDIDPSHSSISFSVKHLMVSKVKGTFGKFSGVIETTEDNSDALVAVTIEANSIDTKDENRDAHLYGEDFFDVAKFPTLTFVSTNVEHKKGDLFALNGNLTIKGVTRPVTLDVEFAGVVVDPFGQTKAIAEASTKISRSDFGLTWNSALEAGGVLVGDEITISLDVQAVLQ